MKRLTGLALIVGLAASLLLYIPGARAEPFAQGHVSGTVVTTGSLVSNLACTEDPAHKGDPAWGYVGPDTPGYQFQGVAIVGTFRADNGAIFAGSISVDDTHGRARQCNTSGTTGDMGTVNCPNEWYEFGDRNNPVQLTNSCTTNKVAITNFAPAHFDVTSAGVRIVGLYYGTYLRSGPHVEVKLAVYTRINPPSSWGTGATAWQNCATKNSLGQLTGPDGGKCPAGNVYVVAEFVPNLNAELGWTTAGFNGTWGSTKSWP